MDDFERAVWDKAHQGYPVKIVGYHGTSNMLMVVWDDLTGRGWRCEKFNSNLYKHQIINLVSKLMNQLLDNNALVSIYSGTRDLQNGKITTHNDIQLPHDHLFCNQWMFRGNHEDAILASLRTGLYFE